MLGIEGGVLEVHDKVLFASGLPRFLGDWWGCDYSVNLCGGITPTWQQGGWEPDGCGKDRRLTSSSGPVRDGERQIGCALRLGR